MLLGHERFTFQNQDLDFSVLDFWQWSSSNLLINALRGVVAEFIVGNALQAVSDCRVEWDSCDIKTPEGYRVEVKSSAYLQAWNNPKPSQIYFSIAPTLGWNSETNVSLKEAARSSDAYVFCVYAHRDRDTADILNLDHWQFYIVPTTVFNEKCPNQKTIRLDPLLKIGAVSASYKDLRQRFLEIMSATSTPL